MRLSILSVVLLGLMAGAANAETLYDCKQSTDYKKRPASTRRADVKDMSPKQQDDYFMNLLGYYCSGDYMSDIADQVAAARRTLELRIAHGGKKPAIVLDIDETSLTNWQSILGADLRAADIPPEQKCDDLKAGCGYDFWEHEGNSDAIKPTLDLFQYAKAHKISVFFVTGRFEEATPIEGRTLTMRQDTKANLDRSHYDGYTCLFLQPRKANPEQAESKPKTKDCRAIGARLGESYTSVGLFKLAARQAIMAQGYTIVLNMGDQLSDLGANPGVYDGTSQAQVLLPNPFYGQ
jgi:predicted secreted acid phosphatase